MSEPINPEALVARSDPRDLQRLEAFLAKLEAKLRQENLPETEIHRLLAARRLRRLKRLPLLPAKRRRRRDKRAYRQRQTEKAIRRWQQAMGAAPDACL